MFVVLDTNVLISGIFWSDPPSDILKEWQHRRFELALTSEIFEEYKRVADFLIKKISLGDSFKPFYCLKRNKETR